MKNTTQSFACTLVVAALALAVQLTGCAAIVDLKDTVTQNPARELDSGLVWNTRVPDIYLPDQDELCVYFHLRNLSGEDGAAVDEVEDAVRAAIEDKGYRLVRRPDDANFTIRADLRFMGENPAGATRGRGLFSSSAVAASALSTRARVSGASAASRDDSDGLVGSMMSEGMHNASRIVEWTLLLDFFISERMEGSEKRLAVSSETHASESTALADGASRRADGRSSKSSASQSGVREQQQFDHECSMTAWANKRRCTREEASSGYLEKVAMAVKEILPDLG